MDDPFGPSIVIFIALTLAAIVRMAEAVVPFVDEGETQKKADIGDAKARRVLKLVRKAERPFGEFRMSWICLVLIAFTSLFALLYRRVDGNIIKFALYGLLPFTLVSLTVAGAIPGHLGAHFRNTLLDAIAPVADWTMMILSPVTRLCMALGVLVLKPFRIKPADVGDAVTEEDIMQMVDIGEEKGAIEADEREMIENIFEFNNMNAGDCMIHRKDITAIDIESTDAEILETIRQSGLSRFPVYEGSIDNVLGILTTRDYLLSRADGRNVPLRALVRPAHFVPESVRTDVLFQEMQSRKQHMAIVVDEYGGTSGLITLEDLLEEIVGNIYDEFDPKEEPEITKLDEKRWRVSGAIDLETLSEALEIQLPTEEEYDTLGGLVFSRLTEIPADGERPVVACFGLKISVERIADRRVEWAVVEKTDADEDAGDGDEKRKEDDP